MLGMFPRHTARMVRSMRALGSSVWPSAGQGQVRRLEVRECRWRASQTCSRVQNHRCLRADPPLKLVLAAGRLPLASLEAPL